MVPWKPKRIRAQLLSFDLTYQHPPVGPTKEATCLSSSSVFWQRSSCSFGFLWFLVIVRGLSNLPNSCYGVPLESGDRQKRHVRACAVCACAHTLRCSTSPAFLSLAKLQLNPSPVFLTILPLVIPWKSSSWLFNINAIVDTNFYFTSIIDPNFNICVARFIDLSRLSGGPCLGWPWPEDPTSGARFYFTVHVVIEG